MINESSQAVGHSMLRRRLGATRLQFLAIGSAIGSGFFIGSGQALSAAGPSLLLAYVLCGVPIYFIARSMGAMTLAYPEDATFFDQIRHWLGRGFATASEWCFLLGMVLVGMVELTAISLLVHQLLPHIPQALTAALVIASLLFLNLLTVERFATAEIWMSLLKVFAILAFILLGVLAFALPDSVALARTDAQSLTGNSVFATGLHGFVGSLPIAFFAFAGFEVVSLASAEAREPEKSIPRAINGLLIRFMIFYLGATGALLVLLPLDQIKSGTSPFVTALQAVNFPAAAIVLDVVLISAIASSLNSIIFGGTRVVYTMALAGNLPSGLSKLNRAGVPGAATLCLAGAIALAVILNALIPTMVFGVLLIASALTAMVVYAMVLLAALRFERSSEAQQRMTLRVPFAPWSVLLSLAILAAVFTSAILFH